MEAVLTAKLREETGKGSAHRLRAKEEIPAVMYGKENVVITLDSREVRKVLSDLGTSHLLQLTLQAGKKSTKHPVLIKEVQVDPIKNHLLHVDLYEVSLDHKVTLTVPVVLVGHEERANDGSLIEQLMHEIEVSCLPTEIPKKIEVDISQLAMNESIFVKDLTPPEGVEFTTALEEAIVSATPPRVETEEEAKEEETEEDVETAAAPEAE